MPDRTTSNAARVTRKALRSQLRRARAGGNWFIFYRRYVTSGLLKREMALFVQDVLNFQVMRTKGKGGWFRLTVKDLQKSLMWDHNTQAKYLRELQDMGWIEVKRKGLPCRRFVRINDDKVTEDMDKAEQEIVGQKQDTLPEG